MSNFKDFNGIFRISKNTKKSEIEKNAYFNIVFLNKYINIKKNN